MFFINDLKSGQGTDSRGTGKRVQASPRALPAITTSSIPEWPETQRKVIVLSLGVGSRRELICNTDREYKMLLEHTLINIDSDNVEY